MYPNPLTFASLRFGKQTLLCPASLYILLIEALHSHFTFFRRRADLCRAQASPRPSLRSSFLPTLPRARSQHRRPQRNVVTCGLEGGNLFLELIGSVAAGAVVAGVTIATSENREAEFERVKTVEGAIPFAAALGADAVAHSLPGLNVLLDLLSEPAGEDYGLT